MITKSQVKYIQTLDQKKFRDQEGVFVAEGGKIARDLLAHPSVQPVGIYLTAIGLDRNKELLKNFESIVHIIHEHELQKVSFLKTPPDILLLLKKPAAPLPGTGPGLRLLLDGIQDPGNLGTIIRLADWFGITDILCSETSADAYAPKVVQATMGSLLRVNIHYTDLEAFMRKSAGSPFYAATLDGEPFNRFAPMEEGGLLIGNEARGISDTLLSLCTRRITIPRAGLAESLNAAVAAGILLSRLVAIS